MDCCRLYMGPNPVFVTFRSIFLPMCFWGQDSPLLWENKGVTGQAEAEASFL